MSVPANAIHQGISAITCAAYDSRIQCLKILLDHKADPTASITTATHYYIAPHTKSIRLHTALKQAGAKHTQVLDMARNVGQSISMNIDLYFQITKSTSRSLKRAAGKKI